MHKSRRLKITDINPHLTCVLCSGYLIDATTIIECLHSFCRSCIVKYLESNKYCPICDVQVHKTKPLLNIRSDQTLQDIVYKLVPGLFQDEMCRRRDFYAKHPEKKPSGAEESGEVTQFSHIYTADESISLSLEYYSDKACDYDNNSTANTHPTRRYLRCPAAVSVSHLQKLIRAKYGLSNEHRVDILYMDDRLSEDFSLMDIAYIYLWRRKGPLHLTYRIFEVSKRIKLSENVESDAKEQSALKIEKENTVANCAEDEATRNEWKEVQLQISENGIMSVTNIRETKPTETITSTVVQVKHDHEIPVLSPLQPPVKFKQEDNSTTMDGVPLPITGAEKVVIGKEVESPGGNLADLTEKAAKAVTNPGEKGGRLGKHKLQEGGHDSSESSPKLARPNVPRSASKPAAAPVKNVQQLSRNHPLKIHSQTLSRNHVNNPTSTPLSNSNTQKANTAKSDTSKAVSNNNNHHSKPVLKPGISSALTPPALNSSFSSVLSSAVTPVVNSILSPVLSPVQSKEQIAPTLVQTATVQTSQNLAVEGPNKPQNCASAPNVTANPTSVEKVSNSTALDTKKCQNSTGGPKNEIRQDSGNDPTIKSDFENSNSESPKIPVTSSANSNLQACGLKNSSLQIPKSQLSTAETSLDTDRNIQASKLQTAPAEFSPSNPDASKSDVQPPKLGANKPKVQAPKPNLQPAKEKIQPTKMNLPPARTELQPSKADATEAEQQPENERAQFGKEGQAPKGGNLVPKIGAQTPKTGNQPSKAEPQSSKVGVSKPDVQSSKTDMQPSQADVQAPKIDTQPPKVGIQSSKVGIVPKKSPVKLGAPIGYKTLRDPPKAWNPQLPRQNFAKTPMYTSNNGASTSDQGKGDSRAPTKPAKFFKMRNNMPRYLGNPASGVKPMYQVRDTPRSDSKDGEKSAVEASKTVTDTKKAGKLENKINNNNSSSNNNNNNNNNNREEKAPKKETKLEVVEGRKPDKRQQSIIKIDPKTLRPIPISTASNSGSDAPLESPGCSDPPEMKINQSTVSIFNPLRTQKSQTSPKVDRRSPKNYTDMQQSSLRDRNSPKTNSKPQLGSPNSKKDKLSLNFTPSNPFIPNLTSPNLAPNQFLYPNFASYDPRVMNNLSAYHNLPFSMYFSQPRLNYPGLPSQNLPLPNLMSSLNLEVNKTRKNYEIPSMMQQLSPTLEAKKSAACPKRDSFNNEAACFSDPCFNPPKEREKEKERDKDTAEVCNSTKSGPKSNPIKNLRPDNSSAKPSVKPSVKSAALTEKLESNKCDKKEDSRLIATIGRKMEERAQTPVRESSKTNVTTTVTGGLTTINLPAGLTAGLTATTTSLAGLTANVARSLSETLTNLTNLPGVSSSLPGTTLSGGLTASLARGLSTTLPGGLTTTLPGGLTATTLAAGLMTTFPGGLTATSLPGGLSTTLPGGLAATSLPGGLNTTLAGSLTNTSAGGTTANKSVSERKEEKQSESAEKSEAKSEKCNPKGGEAKRTEAKRIENKRSEVKRSEEEINKESTKSKDVEKGKTEEKGGGNGTKTTENGKTT